LVVFSSAEKKEDVEEAYRLDTLKLRKYATVSSYTCAKIGTRAGGKRS
jgi:hypothetical protein